MYIGIIYSVVVLLELKRLACVGAKCDVNITATTAMPASIAIYGYGIQEILISTCRETL